jgi:phosphoglucomutase/phosphomannomutase-like protein
MQAEPDPAPPGPLDTKHCQHLEISYGALTIYLITHFHLHYPAQTAHITWGPALSTVLTFSILAWTYKLSTTSRFAVPSAKTGGTKASYFLAPSVGIMLAVLVFGVLGAFSNQATGNWNIALLGSSISGWGFVAAVGAALAVIHTNSMNLYPSTVDLLVALNNVHKPTKWEQPLATVGLGILGTILAIAGILDHVQTLITDAGDIIIPFTFVMLVDWIYVQRRRTPATAFFQAPRTLADRVVPSAIAAVAVGFVLGFWGTDFLPGFFYGYEQALGYTVRPDLVTDKDGISAALLALQLATEEAAHGRTLSDRLDDLAMAHGVHVTGLRTLKADGETGLAELNDAVERVRKEPPRLLAGQPVTVTDLDEKASGLVDLAGGHAERSPGQPLPAADVLIWHVGSHARVMIRPSGTEPELKVYAEVVRPVGSRTELAAARASATEQAERMLAAAAAELEPNTKPEQSVKGDRS